MVAKAFVLMPRNIKARSPPASFHVTGELSSAVWWQSPTL